MKRRRLTKRRSLFVVSAPSGCGKTTVCKRLTSSVPGLVSSVSVTTRPPRKNETNGRDYYFVARSAFLEMRRKGCLLEWAQNFGYFYGTPLGHVEKTLKEGKDILLAIDVKGAKKVKAKMPSSVHIFLAPPSMTALRKRLEGRGTEEPEKIKKRLDIARREMAQADRYDHIVVNDTLSEAVDRLKRIVRSERKNKG